MKDATDTTLLEAVARGNEHALTELRARYQPQLLARVVGVLRNPVLAEEVMQELWLFVWTDAHRYRADQGRPATWLTMLAHRRAVDAVRSTNAARQRDQRWAVLSDPPQHDIALEHTEAAWTRTRLRRALEQLTPAHRTAIELTYFGGHRQPEIASMLGIPVSTARTRLRDALLRLARLLGELEHTHRHEDTLIS